MKLLIIVLCLLSERYLVHAGSEYRHRLFSLYTRMMSELIAKRQNTSNPWIVMMIILLPALLFFVCILYFLSSAVFGLLGFILNLFIFYICIGPENAFYPVLAEEQDKVASYLAKINQQIFAPIFWYIVLGPLAILAYRIIYTAGEQVSVASLAQRLIGIIDWLPVRLTALFYLLVGNFQAGKEYFIQAFLSGPEHNKTYLSTCALHALGGEEHASVNALPRAEQLVLHAMVALLVLIACFTLVAWM